MKKTLLSLAVASSLVLVGCGEAEQGNRNAVAPNVVAMESTTVMHQQSKTYVGRVQAVEDANITAQVSGYLKDRLFIEGQLVEKGDVLYQIEPSSFDAQVATAKASLAQAHASLKKAEMDFKRGKNLLPKGNISKSEFDTLTAAKLSAEAQVEAAEAQLNLANVNLSHTQITAPFTGRISSSNVSIGDLVSPSSGPLTTIVSLDPIHTSFNVSERERLEFGMDKVKGDGEGAAKALEVVIKLENGNVYEHKGKLDFIGNRINLNTGTIALRASVANPDHALLPGQHVRVAIQEQTPEEVVVIPRRAVQTDLEGDFIMIVAKGNIAERRNITLGKQTEQGVIVTEGLAKGEQVVTQGLQRVRNGMPVNIQDSDSANTGA
ncbi:efflux RND transporter periplasmic adaptor subunit [Vibrio nigripulchritudo]|uniref:efflux RND transporter periplasmic adaptor subunit n=1 Tax=Vibrio nigripulchritudo TaxID=28173 RepID=UPI0003B1981F|nr:efflux RND transporter periplasmic adaptor subunit [Vibrio nigripulchritudo]CCN73729.1 putative Secretion protein HlyD [Vibrio nigripulchritudo SFn118]BCL72883.1 MexE family multidrug efflux RND transporter periplasmic adaptor subunit [Vibrio nigripulchritudo]BDU34247.1 MexE family multidrug efflux RND transporter periplasmic adaptor subunit [Vibrio nigripulchritudo]BDU40303.1 MexE family multidrug efflux RND transporter periplasmic adaptor subunit [Vibrio nigripulchritudo]BDU46038.1 MexE f